MLRRTTLFRTATIAVFAATLILSTAPSASASTKVTPSAAFCAARKAAPLISATTIKAISGNAASTSTLLVDLQRERTNAPTAQLRTAFGALRNDVVTAHAAMVAYKAASNFLSGTADLAKAEYDQAKVVSAAGVVAFDEARSLRSC
jgi:hypothetical protein